MGEVAEKFGSPRARTQRKSAHSKTLKCQECNGKGQVNVWMGFDYWYDLDAIRKPHATSTIKRAEYEWHDFEGSYHKRPLNPLTKEALSAGKNPGDAVETKLTSCDYEGGMSAISPQKRADMMGIPGGATMNHPLGKNPGDYWSIVTKGFPGAHFAVFPEDLIEPIIKSSCPPDGVVLDPFCGSGTTCLVAMKLGRKSIGIDINSDYIKIAQKRCRVDISSLQDFGEGDD
jgi:hypothetical protein